MSLGNELWHRPVTRIRGCDLSVDTGQTSGMSRFEAVSGKTVGSSRLWMGRTHVKAGASSGNHHHGDAETSIYIVSGTPRFIFGEDHHGELLEVAVDTEPGDFIFVPPWVPHREENPGGTEAIVVIARSSQEGIVVNLPDLWTPNNH